MSLNFSVAPFEGRSRFPRFPGILLKKTVTFYLQTLVSWA